MFNEVELTNFRQHRKLTLTLQPGVVALRGSNEAGKTTVLEGIAYALGGATALREPLADTVTWGEKETSLKVRLVFTLNGVTYTVTRGKSGAEIKNADGRILATGQTEVTKYIDTLLQCTADVRTNLMLANQASLRGALSKGPGAAIELIETLADFKLIDTVIGLAQTKLPSGTTATAEARVQTLEAQIAVPVEDDTGPYAEQLEAAVSHEQDQQQLVLEARTAYDEVQEPARTAQLRLDALERAQQAVTVAQSRYNNAQVALDSLTVPDAPNAEEIEELRKQAADQGRLARAAEAANTLNALPEPANEWEGTLEELQAEMLGADRTKQQYSDALRAADTKIIQLRAQKITQTACGLCGKDLSQVPEVVTKNAEIDAQIAAIEAKLAEDQQAFNEAKEMHDTLSAIVNHHYRVQPVYAKYAEFIELHQGYVPHRWGWTGPDNLDGAGGDAAKQLAAAEAKVKARDRVLGQQEQQKQAVKTAWTELEQTVAVKTKAELDAEGQQAVLDDAAAKTSALNAAEVQLRQAQEAVKSARQALQSAQALLGERQRARKVLEGQLADARRELVEMEDNNALIKALRAARPEVSDELWGIVNGTVSKYFSDIRGTVSTVTREGNVFKVDGQSIGGLSGSTLDALGLAIRWALTKTFLPNARFAMLDEPAAAADDEREANMLGLIATSDFEQVILITHSDLADSFASQVIRL